MACRLNLLPELFILLYSPLLLIKKKESPVPAIWGGPTEKKMKEDATSGGR